MKKLIVGIASYDEMQARSLAEKGPDRKIIPHALYSDVELKYSLLVAQQTGSADTSRLLQRG